METSMVLAYHLFISSLIFPLVAGLPSERNSGLKRRERRQTEDSNSKCPGRDNPCKGKGLCRPVGDSYECDCHSNLYEGEHCGKKVQHCNPTRCLNGGFCEEAQGTFFCTCPKSFEGVQCEIAVTEERERAEGHFLWYESDIYEAENQTFIILLKIIGSNLRYEFSSGDGFKFTAIDKTFSHSSSAKEFALKNNVNSEDIPAEPRRIILFHYVYRKIGTYFIDIKLLSNENLVMETKLPVVVYKLPNKCVPNMVALQGCGNTADSEMTYFRAMQIIATPRVKPACTDTAFEYLWTLYEQTPEVPYPERRSYMYAMKSSTSGSANFYPYYLPAKSYMLSCTISEIDKINDERTHSNSALCWFRVIKRVPNAVLVGGNQRIVDWAEQFVVDGSTSVDIDTQPEYRSSLVWRYNWTCWNSKHPEETESFCKGKSTSLPHKESKIIVPAKALVVNETYIFGLIAAIDDRVSELVEQEIVVVEKKPLELELRCKKNCDKLLLPVMSVIYEVVCSSCKGQTIFYGWDMIPGSANKKLNIDWEKETERGRNSSVLVIPANTLLPGDVYTFKVKAVSSYLNQEGSAAVNLRLYSDLVVGKCSVEPTEGVSLITYFTVQCMGFQDNTEASHAALLYQFHQKSLKDDEGELMTLLDYDTEPIGDNMMLVPGDPKKEYNSIIAVKISNHIGMNVWYNLSVKVEPLSTDVEDLDDIEGLMSLLTSKSGDSIHGMLSSGNIPGAMQYITSLTEVISGIKDANTEQRTADIRNNLRENLIEMLNEVTLDSPSVVKQVSTVLFKVASLWENEKPEKSPVLGQETFKVSSEMAKSSGSLILKISNALSNEAWSKEDFYSSGDFRHIARHLMSVGENVILNNRTDKLYRADDDWEEANDDINQSKKLMKEKNEDYPNYKEFDIYYQSNVENFRLASYWFFEGLKRIGNSISADLYLEENAVKLQNKNSFLCLKKFKASDLNGQKFGSPGGYTGLKVSREYAEGIQSDFEDVFSLEVTTFTSNPIWWIQATPNSPEVNTEVVFANFRNLKNVKMVDTPGNLKGVEVFLALNSYEKKVVEGAGNSLETQVGVNEDDVTVHQIQAPDGASIIISFEPPPVQENKFMVVILKNHRPTREDFTGDAVLELPHSNSNLDKKDSLSIFVRGSFNKEEPGFPQFFYLAAMPHPNQSHSNHGFSYKFSVNNLLCNHYEEGAGKWLSDGCEVGHESTFDGIHCACSHLSLFGAAFSVAPNKIDPFSDVKLFLKVVENPVSVAVVCTILLLYIILMVFARRKDLKDKIKRAVIFLEDNDPGDSHIYLITVYTGLGKRCGTTSNVSLRLQGTEGISKIHVLNAKGRKVLQSGGEDWFIMLCPCSLGELLNIRMWHDNSGKKPAWYCKRVIVRELREMQVKGAWIFPIERWLAVYGTPMAGTFTGIMPCCKVGVATPVELRNWKDIFTDTALLGFSDKHLWLSIFYRPVESTFTSCQRLSIATNLLLSTMLVSIMFYGVATAKPGLQLDAGGFRISIREWLVALQSMIITTIINIPIALIFNYSDPSDFKLKEVFSRQEQCGVQEEDQSDAGRNAESKIVEQMNDPGAALNEEKISYANDSPNNDERKEDSANISENFKLPNWCRLIGWCLCIFSILTSSYFISLYGLSYGRIKSLLWLSAVILAVHKKAFLVQPVKILIHSFFQSYARALTGPGEEYLKKNPLLNETQRKDLERNLDQLELVKTQNKSAKISFSSHFPKKNHQPLSRNELKLLAMKEIKWRETCSHTFDILAFVLYVVTLHTITYGTGDPLSWNNANVLERILLNGLNNMEESRPDHTSIVGHNDLFNYLNDTVLPALHASNGFGDISFDADDGWTSHLPSKLLGTPRIRQWRTSSVPCNMPLALEKWAKNKTCLPELNENSMDQCSYGIHWSAPNLMNPNDRIDKMWHCYDPDEIDSLQVVGKLDNYQGHGYASDLGRNLNNSRRVFQYIKDSEWIDRYTRALILEFSMYNVDANLFTIGQILIERSRLGKFVTSHQILTARLVEIHFGQKVWKTVSYITFIFATLFLFYRQCRRLYLSRVFKNSRDLNLELDAKPDISNMPKWKRICIIIFLPTPKGTSLLQQLKGVFENNRPEVSNQTLEEDIELKGLLSKNKSPPVVNPEMVSSTPVYPRYPLKPPSFIEWLLIVMAISILVFYVMRNNAMHEPLQRLDQGAASNERHKFVSLQLGVNWDYAFKYALAFDICVSTSALWCILPSFRRLPEKTLVRTGKGPLPTMLVCFVIMLMAFGCSGHTSSLLGSSTHDFSSVSQSLSTLLGWALGVEASEELLGVGYFGKMLYCTFGIGCAIYIINLFLTIVMEEFTETNREMKFTSVENENEYSIMEFWTEFWQRKKPSFKLCCKIFQRKERSTIPENSGQMKDAEIGEIKSDEHMRKKVSTGTEESPEVQKAEYRRDSPHASSEDSDSDVSGDYYGHFSIYDYLRLRAGGQISSKFKDDCWDEIINPKINGNELKKKKFHHRTRKLSVAWLKRSKDEKNSSKLSWISLEDDKSNGDMKEWDEEDMDERMKAMAAITVVLSQQGVRN